MEVRIEDLPEHDRPRERLWRVGPEALADRELVAILLRTGTRDRNALALAEALLAEAGGVEGLARTVPDELVRLAGIGAAKASSIAAALELARRIARYRRPAAEAVREPADLAALVVPELSRRTRERVLAVVLDRGHRPTRVVPISSGSVDRSLLPVREVLHAVLRCDGVAFALAHNHPAGDPSPSPEDLAATRRIQEAAPLVGLRLVDHLIVGDGSWLSLREAGLLDPA
jgi:DNA repair protein RadC